MPTQITVFLGPINNNGPVIKDLKEKLLSGEHDIVGKYIADDGVFFLQSSEDLTEDIIYGMCEPHCTYIDQIVIQTMRDIRRGYENPFKTGKELNDNHQITDKDELSAM